jgi:hypothetical protein
MVRDKMELLKTNPVRDAILFQQEISKNGN